MTTRPRAPEAKKSLGQNFLVDDHALRSIASLCAADPEDVIVEIGPGTGNLTERLLDVTNAGRVVAVEKDRRMLPLLAERFGAHPRLTVVEGDALSVDLGAFVPEGRRCVAVGNLPYYVATEIHFRLLDERRRFRRLVLMFQREVAERIVAREGSDAYGVPSVTTALWANAWIALRLPPGAFRPSPKVHSAIVVADVALEPRLEVGGDPAGFVRFVRAALAQRRKTLVNSVSGTSGRDRDQIVEALDAVGLPATIRAEACSPETLAALWIRLREGAAEETK